MGSAFDEYLAPLPAEQGHALGHLHQVIRSIVPEAEDTTHTVIRFSPTQPLPEALVAKIVRARMAEIDGINS